MKAKMLLLALAIMGTSLVYSQDAIQENKYDCKKKALKKIKNKMNLVDFKDYVDPGQKERVMITCFVNENNVIEVTNIEGQDEKFNAAIAETLKKHPVKCKSQLDGEEFSFTITFMHLVI